ncbi:MAG: baseplate J/gp47 family protein [Chlamydiota bacterium]
MSAAYTPVYERRRQQLPPIDYTQVDYVGLMEDNLVAIPQYSDRWTDRNANDCGMVILRCDARSADKLAYYLDARTNELYLDTCRQRDSVFDLVKLTGYKPRLAAGGTATIRVTLTTAASTGVILSKWWQARSAASGTGYIMALIDEAVIPAGSTTVDAFAVQGQRYSETFEGDGTQGQTFTLSRTKVCATGFVVDGEEWDEVESLVGQDADAKVYVVRLLWDDTVQIETGDGVEGAVVGSGASAVATYLVTLGTGGNDIGAGAITVPVDPVYDGETQIAASAMIVTNLEAVTGGEDEESDAEIKRNAPRCTHALYRIGPANDTRALIEAFPGVQRAFVLDVNNYSDIVRYHYEQVYVIPAGGGDMSPALEVHLRVFIDERKEPGFEVDLSTAGYVAVDLSVIVYRLRGYTDAEVITAVTEAVQDYFNPDQEIGTVDWMRDVDPEEIDGIIDRLDGVSYTEIVTPAETVEIGPGQFPVLGTLTVTVLEATD